MLSLFWYDGVLWEWFLLVISDWCWWAETAAADDAATDDDDDDGVATVGAGVEEAAGCNGAPHLDCFADMVMLFLGLVRRLQWVQCMRTPISREVLLRDEVVSWIRLNRWWSIDLISNPSLGYGTHKSIIMYVYNVFITLWTKLSMITSLCMILSLLSTARWTSYLWNTMLLCIFWHHHGLRICPKQLEHTLQVFGVIFSIGNGIAFEK